MAAVGAAGSVMVGGGQDDEQATFFVVVGWEQVRDRVGGKILLGVYLDFLALDAHLPLEHRADVVSAILETEPERFAHGAADRLLGLQAGQLERALAAVDDSPI